MEQMEMIKNELLDEVKVLLQDTLQSLQIPQQEIIPNLLTTQQASKLYGQSTGYWKKQIFERNIKFYKMGKSVKLRKNDIENFITQNEVKAS